jgi:uncharacterized membrane protein (DUF2068 family)
MRAAPSQPIARHRGLRLVAIFEATKGIGALVLAFAVWHVVHAHPQEAAWRVVRFLHLAPHGRLAHSVISAASLFTPSRERLGAALVALYAAARFTEGFGLWRERAWAEWFGIATGAIYIPFEIAEIARHPTWLSVGVFVLNVVVVAYLAWVRIDTRARATAAAYAPST